MILNKLIESFGSKKRTLFTTPSHNQGEFIVPKSKKVIGKKFFAADFSEIQDFDNLSNPEGVILESQKRAAEIYQSKFTFYLPNGSTSGVIASMAAILQENDRVLIARNCHRSIYSGLVITGAQPIWLMPEYNEDWGILKPIRAEQVEEKLAHNPNIKAFIMTNPSYEGVISNISKISQVCEKYNVTLIVDEAHGALWNFDGTIGTPSVFEGADITIQSLHKTAGAVNPSAVLHIGRTSKIEPEMIQNALNLTTTSSPSYPILANIEATINFLDSNKGKREIIKLIYNIQRFKKELSKYSNISIYNDNNDLTKVLVQIDGLPGYELSDILFNEHRIEDELANSKSVLFLTGIGTTRDKLDKLKKALIRVSKETKLVGSQTTEYETIHSLNYPLPQIACSPRKIFNSPYKKIKTIESAGEICQELIINYPPGIPILIPGEIIQKRHIDFLGEYESIKVLAGSKIN